MIDELVQDNRAYTYDDKLLVPWYSDIKKRSPDTNTTCKLFNNMEFETPIIPANMSMVSEHEMVNSILFLGGTGAIHRFMSPENVCEQIRMIINNESLYTTIPKFGISVGVDKKIYDLVFSQLKKENLLDMIGYVIVDVAHGDHVLVRETIKDIKSQYNFPIIAGNICTPEAAKRLIDWGADCLKIGIGPGCFAPGEKVKIQNGYKNIEDIVVGDKVLTHRGKYRLVKNALKRKEEHKIYKINNIKCTGNHEFYVLHKKYSKMVNDDNINEYARWMPAKDITKDFYLLKIN